MWTGREREATEYVRSSEDTSEEIEVRIHLDKEVQKIEEVDVQD